MPRGSSVFPIPLLAVPGSGPWIVPLSWLGRMLASAIISAASKVRTLWGRAFLSITGVIMRVSA